MNEENINQIISIGFGAVYSWVTNSNQNDYRSMVGTIEEFFFEYAFKKAVDINDKLCTEF